MQYAAVKPPGKEIFSSKCGVASTPEQKSISSPSRSDSTIDGRRAHSTHAAACSSWYVILGGGQILLRSHLFRQMNSLALDLLLHRHPTREF